MTAIGSTTTIARLTLTITTTKCHLLLVGLFSGNPSKPRPLSPHPSPSHHPYPYFETLIHEGLDNNDGIRALLRAPTNRFVRTHARVTNARELAFLHCVGPLFSNLPHLPLISPCPSTKKAMGNASHSHALARHHVIDYICRSIIRPQPQQPPQNTKQNLAFIIHTKIIKTRSIDRSIKSCIPK